MCWGGFADCSLDIAIELGVHNLPQVKKYSLSIANFPEDFPVMSLNLRRNVTLSVVSKNLGAAKSNVANCVPHADSKHPCRHRAEFASHS